MIFTTDARCDFQMDHQWAKLPGEIRLGFTHGVVTDAEDNVYVHNQSPHAVVVFDREGNYLRSWGEEFSKGAHGMRLSREKGREYLYLADYARHLVAKTTLDGERIWTIGVPPLAGVYASADTYLPTDVAVAPNGDVYVTDGYGRNYIHQYDNDGKYLRSFGGEGSGEGQLKCPHGVWVDTRRETPLLYVADRANVRIQKFTLDGKHAGFVSGMFRHPCGFFEFQGDLYIPDLHGRLTILDRDDKLIGHVGDNENVWKTQGWPNIQDKLRPGLFNSPHACCVDSRGDVYVVEWISTGRITKLTRA